MNETAIEPTRPVPDIKASAVTYRRSKKTSRRVILIDRAADLIITWGGLAVIATVFAIMAFLVWVVVPLFTGGDVVGEARYRVADFPQPNLLLTLEEENALALALSSGGLLQVFHPGTGRMITTIGLDLAAPIAAVGRTLSGDDIALGFADGSVRLGRIAFVPSTLTASAVPEGLTILDARDRTDGRAAFSIVPGNQFRRVEPMAQFEPPQQIADAGVAIAHLAYRIAGTVERPTQALVTVDALGKVRLGTARTKKNMLTKKETRTVSAVDLPPFPGEVAVVGLLLTERADQVYVGLADGRIVRYSTVDPKAPVVTEIRRVVPEGVGLTALGFLNGEQSIVVGGSDGSVSIWFRLPDPSAGTADRLALTRARVLEPHGAPVVAFEPSRRTKTFVSLSADGEAVVRHATSEQVLFRLTAGAEPGRGSALALAPKDDGVLAVAADGRAARWLLRMEHPETTWGTLFGRVWYEGYGAPDYTWQSSSGTDTFEPKLSLVPLVFGTIKATVYSLLFAVPIALVAAIYTSQFVHPGVRGAVKPTMEMMAGLPSVVLGFIAALILAPIIEAWIAAVILAFATLPFALLAAAHLWQLLPQRLALRLDGMPKLALFAVVGAIALYAAYALGPAFERAIFAGDFRLWTAGAVGSDLPLMTLIAFPFVFLAIAALVTRLFGARLEAWRRAVTLRWSGVGEAARWAATLVASGIAAYGVAVMFDALGIGVRGAIVDTYVQRNTLVVGFAMGFAVIPIIYSIAEDALSAVPEHLRAAGLAAGATPWQTATRIIVPTAASGIFAAVMIGMGRAVGETMIVVMAAGNTPVLDWNIFSGLRALSANIAVELPEAVKDSTLYRVLFLAALTLFIMTFVLNTVAELVRLRFRHRAAQL